MSSAKMSMQSPGTRMAERYSLLEQALFYRNAGDDPANEPDPMLMSQEAKEAGNQLLLAKMPAEYAAIDDWIIGYCTSLTEASNPGFVHSFDRFAHAIEDVNLGDAEFRLAYSLPLPTHRHSQRSVYLGRRMTYFSMVYAPEAMAFVYCDSGVKIEYSDPQLFERLEACITLADAIRTLRMSAAVIELQVREMNFGYANREGGIERLREALRHLGNLSQKLVSLELDEEKDEVRQYQYQLSGAGLKGSPRQRHSRWQFSGRRRRTP